MKSRLQVVSVSADHRVLSFGLTQVVQRAGCRTIHVGRNRSERSWPRMFGSEFFLRNNERLIAAAKSKDKKPDEALLSAQAKTKIKTNNLHGPVPGRLHYDQQPFSWCDLW